VEMGETMGSTMVIVADGYNDFLNICLVGHVLRQGVTKQSHGHPQPYPLMASTFLTKEGEA
jgi:hypothetical protein